MNEKNLYILLKIIFNNSSVKQLSREGMSFSKIAVLTSESIKDGLIIQTNDRIMLSEIGIEKLKELEKNYKKTNKEEWIMKDLKNKIVKLDENILFLPRQNELSF
jgi:hypothetical protein